MNRSVLCNCDIEAEGNFLLELLVACGYSETKTNIVMCFTVNLAFVIYFDYVIQSVGVSIFRNWINQEQYFTHISGII